MIKYILYLLLYLIGTMTALICVIDLMAIRTIWVKQTNLNYVLDLFCFISGYTTAFRALKLIDK